MNLKRVLKVADRSINLVTGFVDSEAARTRLTPREFELLCYLVKRSGELVTREELLVRVRGYHPDTQTRAVDATSVRLRKKIEQDYRRPVVIQSVYGEVYRLRVSDTAVELAEASTHVIA